MYSSEFAVKMIFDFSHMIQDSFEFLFICIYKVTCIPKGNFVQNLNLDKRVQPSLVLMKAIRYSRNILVTVFDVTKLMHFP